ncbi:MAG TPA: hypothetical protein VLA35_13190, partial [Thermoleophilia bacterium]|nr:hypothetical protein [Thermoleophilia bacterium]
MSASRRSEPEGGGLSPLERRAVEMLDHEALTGLLLKLIALPSHDGRETPAQETVAAWMAEAGLEPEVWPIDLGELRRH